MECSGTNEINKMYAVELGPCFVCVCVSQSMHDLLLVTASEAQSEFHNYVPRIFRKLKTKILFLDIFNSILLDLFVFKNVIRI